MRKERGGGGCEGHSCPTPPAVCVSQQQEWVQAENDGKSARRLGEVPQPLTLSERKPSQQEVDREEKGVWGKSEFNPDRGLERNLAHSFLSQGIYSKFYNEEK